MANDIILAREHKIFAVPETTRGTLAFPTSSDLIVPAGSGSLNQVATYTDSEEIVDSRDLIAQFRDAVPAGDWSLPMFLRPSGSAGTAPQGATLFESLFGTETVTASTSVAYTLAKALPSFSLWAKVGDTVFFASGATVNEMRLQLTKKGAVKLDLSGKFMAMGVCGTDYLDGAIDYIATPITAIPVLDARKFMVGGKVTIGTDNNSSAGFLITAVNTTTDTLTISPGIATDQSSGAEVVPFLPSGTVIGSPLESKDTVVSFDGGSTATKIKSMDLTFTNNIQYMDEELSDDEYATDYVEDRRSVKGSVTILMRRDDATYFYDALNTSNQKDVEIAMGPATAGARASFSMPIAQLAVPQVSLQSPTVEMSMELTALGSTAGEDSISLMFD